MPASVFCVACSDLLGVTGAGMSVRSRRGSLDLVGVSGDVARLVEQVETAVGEGPCMTAFRSEEPVFANDLRDGAGSPWPEFRRRALTIGIRAAFGFPLARRDVVHRRAEYLLRSTRSPHGRADRDGHASCGVDGPDRVGVAVRG